MTLKDIGFPERDGMGPHVARVIHQIQKRSDAYGLAISRRFLTAGWAAAAQ